MRVDILIAVAEQGGVENVINMMAPYLQDKRGWNVRVVQLVFEGKYWTTEEIEFFPILRCKCAHTPKEFAEVYAKFISERGEPDIILATAWPFMCYVGKRAAAIIGKQDIIVLSWLHTIAKCYELAGYGKYAHLALADGHLAISQMIYDDIRDYLPEALILPVHNPVNLETYSIRHKKKRKDDCKKLFFVGRISGEKRLDIIIKAWENAGDKWKLYIIGDGEATVLDNIRRATKEYRADRLYWLGWKENPWAYACEADALVLASEYEGFPLTAIEALANGVPVISTPVSGITELINPGENGYLFPFNDWQSLAKILRMIGDGVLPAIDQEKCRQSVKIFQLEKALSDFACKVEECRKNRQELRSVGKNAFLYANDKISVIIPCYNAEKYINECLDSVLLQTLPIEMLELIIIDDASTDNTALIIEQYERKYPENILFIKCENKVGVGEARNIGLDYASGEYIAFIDADDRMNPYMLQKLYEKMALYELDMAGCGYQSFCGADILEKFIYTERMYHLRIKEEKKEFILEQGTKNAVWAHMYKKAFLDGHHILFPKETYMEDLFFHQLCIMQAESYYEIAEPLYYYRINPKGIMQQIDSHYFMDSFRMQNAVYDVLEDNGLQKGFEEELAVIYYVQAFVTPLKYMKNETNGIQWDENLLTVFRNTLLRRFPDIRKNIYILSDESEYNKQFLRFLEKD